MKSLDARSVLMWLLSLVMLAALGSCGGSDDEVRAFVATLTGAQEVPPSASTATGSGTANLDPATKILTANVTTTGIVGTAAHIHSGAVGISGPIVFPLTQTPAGSGIWSTTTAALTDAQVDLLKSGGYYFNVHSAALPGGEIRGQITAPASGSGFQATTPAAPAPVPAPVPAIDGAALYTSNCAGCHGPLASSSKRGTSAVRTQTAINANVGGMGALSSLTPAQVSAIATALGGTP